MIVNKRSLLFFRLLSDLIILNSVFILSAFIAQSWEILLNRYYMFFLLIALNFIWIVTNLAGTFYDDFYSRNISVQILNIIKSTIIQVITTIIFIFLAKEDLFTRNFIVLYSAGLLFFIFVRVALFRKTLKVLRRKGKNIRNLAILGSGELANNFYSMVKSNPDFGYKLVGFISEKKLSEIQTNSLGPWNDFENIFHQQNIEELVVAVDEALPAFLNEVVNVCNKLAVKVHIIPDYLNFLTSKMELSTFGNYPVVTVRKEPLEEAQWRILKRSFDIIFSIIVTITLLSWLVPLIFIFSKLSSPGPVFYVQERYGAKNKKFNCYKFRTMRINSNDNQNKIQPVVENDERVTRIGKILRKTNLDELPQFFNILKGDMSVVGPRPQYILFYTHYQEIVEEIRLRHNVKPGLTGWAQIHGLRGDPIDEEKFKINTRKRIEYDLWYIENWSFTLDMQIIFTTVWQMIKGKTYAV